MKSKMLVVYYSISNGNTKRIAERLQKAVGADIAQIETVQPYLGSYEDIVEQGRQEVDSGYLPEIKALPFDVRDYDIIASP